MINVTDQNENIVTLELNPVASNTFNTRELQEDEALLFHPLADQIFLVNKKSDLNKTQPRLKDSTERVLTFVKNNKTYLDYDDRCDLESLCMYFVVKRTLTKTQKQALSSMGGKIAASALNNSINDAINLVVSNDVLLDEFNLMWYKNFSKIFSGKDRIVSVKQRSVVFNMSGFILAQIQNPQATQGNK